MGSRSLGLSRDDLSIILADTQSFFSSRAAAVFDREIRTFHGKHVASGPRLHIDIPRIERFAYRYCGAVSTAAAHLAERLAQSMASRQRLNRRQVQVIKQEVAEFIAQKASPGAARDISTLVFGYRTTNGKEIEQTLSRFFAKYVNRGDLTKAADDRLRLALALHGEARSKRTRKAGREALQPKGLRNLPQKKHDHLRFMETANLTERQWDCYSLKFEYWIPITEIARRLGLHHSTVQEHIAQARKRIDNAWGRKAPSGRKRP